MNKIEAMLKCRETKMPAVSDDGTVFSYTAAGVYEHEPDSGKRVLRRQKYIKDMSLSADVKKSDIGELMSLLQKEKEESEEVQMPKPKAKSKEMQIQNETDIIDLLNPRFETMNSKLNDISTFLVEKHKRKQTQKRKAKAIAKKIQIVDEEADEEDVDEEIVVPRPKTKRNQISQPQEIPQETGQMKNNLIDEIANLFTW